MVDSEVHHHRPALSGVVVAIENLPAVREVLGSTDINFAKRFRQAVGVAVRVVMEWLGWQKTGEKWSVGVGEFFSKAEHYVCSSRPSSEQVPGGEVEPRERPIREAFQKALADAFQKPVAARPHL
jgi:hypothetical protein